MGYRQLCALTCTNDVGDADGVTESVLTVTVTGSEEDEHEREVFIVTV
jgi:hypothetical protein